MLILKSINFEQQTFQKHELKQVYPEQKEWLIGRNPSCDLVLGNPEVSRSHGRIIYSDNAYYFMDAGSRSGSVLNGEGVPANETRKLHPGDLLQLGETFLYVDVLTTPLPNSVNPVASLGQEQLENQWTTEDLICRCCRIVDETPDVKTFYFMAEPAVLFSYKPGQFVNLELEIDGKSVIRPYSISSSPTRPYHLSVTVKRVPSPPGESDVPPGLVSNWLHDHLKEGDRVKLINGPMGNFTCLPDLPSKMLLISAGSGITPMMSMTRWVQDTLAESDVIFLHSARTSDDIVFRAELEAIAAQMPNFHLAITLTQQPLGRSWMGLNGRISEAMLRLVTPDLFERGVYVCGPSEFMKNVRTLLEHMQFPMQNYQEESFGDKKRSKPASANRTALASTPETRLPDTRLPDVQIPTTRAPETRVPETRIPETGLPQTRVPENDLDILSPSQLPATETSPVVRFTKSGQQVEADGTASILEIAEDEGIQIRHACRVGACGACKVRVTKGKVRYDTPPAALSSTDQSAGYALACVAYPIHQIEIEA